jgi:spermidine synthase
MSIVQNYEHKGQIPLLSHYVGQINLDLPFLQDVPVNTDDKPVIEYMAPVSHRAEKSGKAQWFIGTELLSAMHQMRYPNDGYLQGLSENELRALFAGYFLHAAQIARSLDDKAAQDNAMVEFNRLIQGL